MRHRFVVEGSKNCLEPFDEQLETLMRRRKVSEISWFETIKVEKSRTMSQ